MLQSIPLSPIENNPLVSVLIANYNYADFLNEAIESVLTQTYSNIEVVICDDGSTDNSIDTIQSIKRVSAKPIHLIKKENGGMASAVNMAFEKSRGQIICFLDADDYYYPNKISRVVRALTIQSDSGLLIHRLNKIDNNDRQYGNVPLTRQLPEGWYGNYVLEYGSCPHGFPVTSALVLRREVAEQIFPVHNGITHDLDEIIRRLALLSTPVISIDESLGVYRIHGQNMSSGDVLNRLEGMLPLYELMWQETRYYLERVSPENIIDFPPLGKDLHLLLMKYVLSRTHKSIERDTDYLWQQIRQHEGFKTWSPGRRSFWTLMSFLPNSTFRRCVRYYWSPNLKLKLSRWKYFLFN